MPTFSVFIRKGDVDKWKSLKNKTQKISDLLNGFPPKSTPNSTKKQGGTVKWIDNNHCSKGHYNPAGVDFCGVCAEPKL